MKRSKICIFCGSRDRISKEHFWPQWLAPFLPQSSPNSHVSEFHSGEGKQHLKLERRSERPGLVQTKKIRAVCTACNNGWISALESKSKPIFIRLINRSAAYISNEEAQTLALWITVKSVVGEYAMEGTALTPQSDRALLFSSQLIPEYFRIFIAYHSLQVQTGYYRQSTTISTSIHGPVPPLPRDVSRNIQATTFFLGPLCIYVTASKIAGFNSETLDPFFSMYGIWPNENSEIDLGMYSPLNLRAVEYVGRSLDRLIKHPRVRYGGPHPMHDESTT
jgi:hypothetical protein